MINRATIAETLSESSDSIEVFLRQIAKEAREVQGESREEKKKASACVQARTGARWRARNGKIPASQDAINGRATFRPPRTAAAWNRL
jgi:hypothetical protein